MMKKLLEEAYQYTLYETDKGLLLAVVCGTVAVYDLPILLDEQETAQYRAAGKAFIDTLAARVSYAPNQYEHRRC